MLRFGAIICLALAVVCVDFQFSPFIPRGTKILPGKSAAQEEILMANIGMTIIYKRKIIFPFYREHNKSRQGAEIFMAKGFVKNHAAFVEI